MRKFPLLLGLVPGLTMLTAALLWNPGSAVKAAPEPKNPTEGGVVVIKSGFEYGPGQLYIEGTYTPFAGDVLNIPDVTFYIDVYLWGVDGDEFHGVTYHATADSATGKWTCHCGDARTPIGGFYAVASITRTATNETHVCDEWWYTGYTPFYGCYTFWNPLYRYDDSFALYFGAPYLPYASSTYWNRQSDPTVNRIFSYGIVAADVTEIEMIVTKTDSTAVGTYPQSFVPTGNARNFRYGVNLPANLGADSLYIHFRYKIPGQNWVTTGANAIYIAADPAWNSCYGNMPWEDPWLDTGE